MWDLIVSVPDHCLSFYFALLLILGQDFVLLIFETFENLKNTVHMGHLLR